MEKKKLIKYFKCTISDSQMSKTLYAIFYTESKLLISHNHSIRKYNRKQSGGFTVDVTIEIDSDRVIEFETLTGFTLHDSNDFQGRMNVNKNYE